MLKKISNILIHFLDEELIALSSFKYTSKLRIAAETDLAFKIALLVAEESVIIPASNYFESRFNKKTLFSYSSFIELGIIELAYSGENINQFFTEKQAQYNHDRTKYPIYFNKKELKETDVSLKWRQRQRSATKDITNSWYNNVENNNLQKKLYSGLPQGAKILNEYELLCVPEKLNGSAFVTEYAIKHINNADKQVQKIIFNLVYPIITTSYIESYTIDFNGFVLGDFNSFDTSIVFNKNIRVLSFARIKQFMYKNNLLDILENANDKKLLELKFSDTWQNEYLNKLNEFLFPTHQNLNNLIININNMEIKKQLNIKSTVINTENYYGLSSEEFQKLNNNLQNLNDKDKEILKGKVEEIQVLPDGEEKTSKLSSLKEFLIETGVAINQNIAASVVYEVIKPFLGI